MPFPLETADTFAAPFDYADREAEAAQHRNDAIRDASPASRRRQIVVLKQAIENAEEWRRNGLCDDKEFFLILHDIQEELAFLQSQETA